MPPQLNGFSPEVQAWLLGLGPSPFALYEDANSQVISNWDPPADLDDLGTMEHQNSRLTAQNKANDQYSDMAQIAQLGGSTGGFSPDQFEPFAIFEPVKAPGYMRMQQFLSSTDPVSRYIAEVINDRGTANQAEVELRQIYNDPSHPLHAEMRPYILDDIDETTGQPLPNWRRIQDIATSLEKDVLYDPQFNATDPATGLPANVKYDETEAAKYFRERNLPNPYETYDPDLLAGRDQLSREGMNRDKRAESDIEFEAAKRSLATARAKDDPRNNSRLRGMTLEGMGGPSGPQGPDLASQAVERATFEKGTPLMFTAGDEMAAPARTPSGGPGGRQQPSTTGSVGRTDSLRSHLGGQNIASEAARRAFTEAILARKDNEKRRGASGQDKIAQIDRQRMMAMLTKQGHTPFNNVNRARQGNVYGF